MPGFNFRFKGHAKEKVQKAFRKALTIVANEMKSDFVKMTGKPVTVWRGRVIRSQPGEAPRKESGRFNRSFHFRTSASPNRDAMEMWSDDPKFPHLELGTKYMAARPSFKLLWEKWKTKLKPRVREVMKQDLQ
jgi:hypothetical protein